MLRPSYLAWLRRPCVALGLEGCEGAEPEAPAGIGRTFSFRAPPLAARRPKVGGRVRARSKPQQNQTLASAPTRLRSETRNRSSRLANGILAGGRAQEAKARGS